jgi:uncharacterized repeat protein (TIGR03803 family)
MRVRPVATLIAVLLLLVAATANPVYKTVYQFPGGQSGGVPVNVGNLAADGAGNLYGTTQQGGTCGHGTVFQLSSAGKEFAVPKMLHSFCSVPDGNDPFGAVVIDESAKNIYGTTLSGGACSMGTVFRVSNSGSGWTETVLHSFCGKTPKKIDGAEPYAGVVLDPGKRGCCYIYGTTRSGGTTQSKGKSGFGTVFGISDSGTYEVIYSFCPKGTECVDGAYPKSGLVVDKCGNLYGMTVAGGSSGNGTIFRISRSGSKWTETVLHSFKDGANPRDGANPQYASLTLADGRIFGVTTAGGDSNDGTVFQMTLSPESNETVLYSFGGSTKRDGAKPEGTLVRDSTGNLYGTTTFGGSAKCTLGREGLPNDAGCGTVFKLEPTNGGWTENVLYLFQGRGDGGYPQSGLVRDPASGRLYGATKYTENICDSVKLHKLYRCGVLYEVQP